MTPDQIETVRLATMLRENAPCHAAIGDSGFAAKLAQVAAALELTVALAALPVPAAPLPPPSTPAGRAPSQRRADLQRQNRATAKAWMDNRVCSWPADRPPPTMTDDIEAARIEIPSVPQQYIEDERWIGWRLRPGRPRKAR